MKNKHTKLITRRHRAVKGTLLIVLLMLCSCVNQPQNESGSIPSELSPYMTYEVVNTFPHDPMAFTQGLLYHEGYLYESTGLYGGSSLRKVMLETGEVLQRVDLPANFFGEGLALWEDRLIQLTWQEGTGFVYALVDFSLLGQFTYPTEGWGLTQDGSRLIMSDGTSRLYFLDPVTFEITGEVEVLDQGQPVMYLNELETINDEVFANVWQTDLIVRIDPATGTVLGWIDLEDILPRDQVTLSADVMNGIAYDPDQNRLFITGKYWPLLFEIRLVPQDDMP